MLLRQHTGESVNALQRLIPRSLENRSALRTAIAVLIAVLVAFSLHLSTPYWAGMTVLIVSNIYIGSILDKALLRIVGTFVGAWFGYLVAAYTVDSFYFFLLVCFFIAAISMYYYQISRYAYAYLLGGITAFLVVAQVSTAPGNAFFVAFWRSAEISLGVIVAGISAFFLFPNNLKNNFDERIHVIFTKITAEVQQLQHFLYTGSSSVNEMAEINLQLKKELKKSMDMLGAMRFEVGISRVQIEKLRSLLEIMFGLMRKLNYFIASLQDEPIKDFVQGNFPIDVVFNAIYHDLDLMKKAYSEHGVSDIDLQTGPAINALEMTLSENNEFSLHKDKLSFRVYHLLQQINEIMINLSALLIDQQRSLIPKDNAHNPVKRLQNDPEVIKQSIKVGLTIVLAMLIWLISSWPGGINGIISSIVISIRTNIFEMKGVSLQRMLGCLLGGGVALTILSLVAMNVYDLVLTLFFLVWAFSYFSFKYPRYSYVGLQANIALIITMAQEGGPPLYLEPPLERLGGIVIGIIASFIVANALWRHDVLSMFAGRLRMLSCSLIENIQHVLTQNKERIILYEVSDLFWVCRGLMDSQANERFNRKKQLKFEALKQSFENSVLIQATVRYIYDGINRADAHLTSARLEIGLESFESSINELYQTPNKDNTQLCQRLDGCLNTLGKKLVPAAVTHQQMTNLLAYLHALRQLARNSTALVVP